MKGQARQNKFPAHKRTRTRTPRKCSQLSVVARFFGARDGPNNPWRIIITLMTSRGACRTGRAYRQRNSRPSAGTRIRSKDGGSGVSGSGMEDGFNGLPNFDEPLVEQRERRTDVRVFL